MGWVPRAGDIVVDRSGMRFELDREIGGGTQGTVFATKAEGAAVKILNPRQVSREAIESQILKVARLPILDLPVAQPKNILIESVIGYSMNWLTAMKPISSLFLDSTAPFSEKWYRDGGGLKKRLKIIESLAEVISSLHARGLVYCDLSGANVLISESSARSQLFLIDLDNLKYSSEIKSIIGTPQYSAPEQFQTGASQLTDDFSLAILAFSVLTGCNPFYGNVLDGKSPDEYQRVPHASLAPWIDDSEDASNRWEKGIDRNLVVSTRFIELFKKSFELGRFNPESRSIAAEFAVAARSARHSVYRCVTCSWDNFLQNKKCESCGTTLQSDYVRLFSANGDRLESFSCCPAVVLDEPAGCDLPGHALGLIENQQKTALTFRKNKKRYEVEIFSKQLSFEGLGDRRRCELNFESPIVIERKNRLPILLKLESCASAS